MIKHVNVASVVQAKSNIEKDIFKSFKKHYNISVSDDEIDDISCLVDSIIKHGGDISDLSYFYIGYKIPQIGKEFDLLRVTENCIVNIEIKRKSNKPAITKQLLRNRYYLKYTGKKIINVSYIVETKLLFLLNKDDTVSESNINFLLEILRETKVQNKQFIDSLFNPSTYLVSPFNSTEKFLNKDYFLTHQQEEIRDKVISEVSADHGPSFFSLKGGPGTGKTLLIYDIAKAAMSLDKSVIIIHVGSLNTGHRDLLKNKFRIISVKNIENTNLSEFDLVIVDESQRIYKEQFDKILKDIKSGKNFCLFSHDGYQTLIHAETQRDIESQIGLLPEIKKYSLSEKIRSNAEISNFIKMILKQSRSLPMPEGNNIEINYFTELNAVESYLEFLEGDGWEIIKFTPSLYQKEYHQNYCVGIGQTSHEVVGQEFEKVAIILDAFFLYDEKGNLAYSRKTYYDPVKMLFQNITRAKVGLNVIILNNEIMLGRCMEIISNK